MATRQDYTNSLLDAKIVLRNDTAANWKMANPILLEGEFAVEIDTKKFKLGDGVTQWNNLKYLEFGSSSGGNDLESRVATLETEMTEAQGNIFVLSTQMEEALKSAADAAEAKRLAEDASTKVDGFDQRITDAESKSQEAIDKVTEIETSVSQYDERISEASKEASEAKSIAQEALDKAATASDKVDQLESQLNDTVKYSTFQDPSDPEPRKTIQLDNHDTISGLTTSGEGVNIAMVSKWDKVDLGSPQVEINLNGSSERPTYNDTEEIALVKDLPSSDNFATKEELNTLSSTVMSFDSRITEANLNAEEALSSVTQYDQEIKEATNLATSASNTASQAAEGLQEIRTTVNNQETRIVALENKGYDGGDIEL